MSDDRTRAPGLIETGAKLMVWLAGASLIIMSFIVTLEALLRKFVGISLGNINEISAYVFAISSAWAFGWALLQGAHIRISALRGRFRPAGRIALDILAWLVFLIVFAIIAFRACDLAWQSYATGARSPTTMRTLLFVPQALWAFGIVMTTLVAIHIGIRTVRERSAEIMAPADEVEAELEHLK